MCSEKRRLIACLLVLVLAAFGSACTADVSNGGYGGGPGGYTGGSGAAANAGGNYGATPGGAQDINYARTQIEDGQVPQANTITAEGLLSEHDIPTSGDDCDQLLCMRPSLGVAPSLETGEQEIWLKMGMVSGFKKGEFERPPMDTVILVDRSGSMSIDMAETNGSVNAMIDQLRDDDRLSIVTFNGGAQVFQEPAKLADLDRAALKHRVRTIQAQGTANMRAGLERAYEVARGMESGPDRMTRVILLSCGYPDATAEGSRSFTGIVEDGAADGIGLTFFGVLLPFHHELANAMSQAPGGNYFYTQDLPTMVDRFRDEFEFMVTPLAYNLKVGLDVDENYEITGLYGLPGEDGTQSAGFDVSTAFISKRGGAMVARLEAKSDAAPDAIGQVNFSYQPETAHGWAEAHDYSEGVTHPGGSEEAHFDNAGVRKSVALVNMAEQLQTALEQYHAGSKTDAESTLQALRDYLDGEAVALDDDGLRDEVQLIDDLLDNMS